MDTAASGDRMRDLLTGDPDAPVPYAISQLYCVPTSPAERGPGPGAMWGRDAAPAMLAGAGFDDVTGPASPRPQNVVYVGRT